MPPGIKISSMEKRDMWTFQSGLVFLKNRKERLTLLWETFISTATRITGSIRKTERSSVKIFLKDLSETIRSSKKSLGITIRNSVPGWIIKLRYGENVFFRGKTLLLLFIIKAGLIFPILRD